MAKRRYRRAPKRTGRMVAGVWQSDCMLGSADAQMDYFERDSQGNTRVRGAHGIVPTTWTARSREYWAGVNAFRKSQGLEPIHRPSVVTGYRKQDRTIGDHLASLAKACGLDVAEVRAINPGKSDAEILRSLRQFASIAAGVWPEGRAQKKRGASLTANGRAR